MDDGFENLLYADSLLGGAEHGLFGVKSQIVFDLFFDAVDIGRRQVDLVDHGNDCEVVLHGRIEVGNGLSLNALGSVDQQQDPFAGSERAGHLV